MRYTANWKIASFLFIQSYIVLTTASNIGVGMFGKALPKRHFAWLRGLSYEECKERCRIRRRCNSVDYNRRTLSCRMNKKTNDADYVLQDEPGMVHVLLGRWEDISDQFPCEGCVPYQTCDLDSEQCIHTECRRFPNQTHGYVEGNLLSVGAKCMLYCDKNTYVINSTVVPVQTQCQQDGYWSVDGIQCLKLSEICQSYLVSGPSGIIAKSITASTTYIPYYGSNNYDYTYLPQNGVLDNDLAWSSLVLDIHQYIQVEFGGLSHVTGVVTQGRYNHQQWVSSYRLAYSTDCATFTDLVDSTGNTVTFVGNTDINSKVVNMLDEPIEALCVRIKPATWNDHISMRMDILGCGPSNISNYRIYNPA